MHDVHDFLLSLALVFGVAAVTTVIFQRLRLPVVFGYTLAGLIIGPHVPVPLVADRDLVLGFSELGVILLMFSLGLEFSLGRLARVATTGGIVALLESSLMMWLGYSAARLFGWSPIDSLFVGGAVAISSTTVILKVFRERALQGSFTEIVFGILIAEDLIAILLLAIFAAITAGGGLSADQLALTVGRLAAFLVVLLVAGMLVIPRLVRFVVRLARPETTLVVAMGLCFAVAWLARASGFSVALGAFLAGAIVAESGEAKRVEKLVEPLRDVFVAMFFVAVGMLIEPAQVARHAPEVAALALLVILGKFGAVSVSAFLVGHAPRTSVQAGMSMAQIGEFSLILAGIGLASGVTGSHVQPVVIAVSALTTLTTPWLVGVADPVAGAIDRRLPRPLQTFAALYGSWVEKMRREPQTSAGRARLNRVLRVLALDAVVVAALAIGASMGSGALAGRLSATTALEPVAAQLVVVLGAVALASPFLIGIVRSARALSVELSTRAFSSPQPGRLDLAAAPRRAFVVTVQLAIVLAIGAPLVAVTQPFLPTPVGLALLIALLLVLAVGVWRSAANLQGHVRAAAEVIVAALARGSRTPAHGAEERALERAYQLIPGLGEPVPVRLSEHDPAVGRTLTEIGLRGHTGATIVAISRGDDIVLVPDGHEVLRPGDVIALAGTRESIDAARRLLAGA